MNTRPAFAVLASLALSLAPCLGCSGSDDDSSRKDDTTPEAVVTISQNIDAATTWSPSSVYVIEGAIAVTEALTLEPGTVVKLKPGASMVAQGTRGAILASTATEAAPCIFTSIKDDAHGGDTNGDAALTAPAPGDWGYVRVSTDGSIFNNCRFLYGGSNMPYTGTLALVNSAATVTNCTFAHNQGGTLTDRRAATLNASSAKAGTVIAGNTFFDNDVPLVINGTFSVDDSNVFHGQVGTETVTNTYNGIFWGGAYTSLTGDITWSATEVPFVVTGNVLGIPAGASLTLADKVILKFDLGQRIDVAGGKLIANGTTEILFTSLRDDSAGGDTNGDGSATVAAPGDWRAVGLAADQSVLHKCRFSYGGSASPYSGTVVVSAGKTATITDCTFTRNAGGTPEDVRAAALNVGGAGAATVITGNLFYDNDLPLVINGLVSLDDSNVFRYQPPGALAPITNTYNGIFMDGTSHSVTASTTWTNTDAAYVVNTVLTVAQGGTLTLGDNVVVKSQGGRIDFVGTITQGTNVRFTSFKDDVLDDSNADGNTTPVKGDWTGINNCQSSPCEWAAWGNIYYATNP